MTINELKRAARRFAGVHASCAVKIIDGSAAPKRIGQRWHYETKGGRYIYHPNAYAARGWSNMVYCHSTLCVVVGAEWNPVAHAVAAELMQGQEARV